MHKENFEDLNFIAVIRFKESEKLIIQDLFYCDTDVNNYLNIRKPRGYVTLEDKKHWLLRYFFKSNIQTLLNTLNNVSRNPGC